MPTEIQTSGVWLEKAIYSDAERRYHERLAKLHKQGSQSKKEIKDLKNMTKCQRKRLQKEKQQQQQQENEKNLKNIEKIDNNICDSVSHADKIDKMLKIVDEIAVDNKLCEKQFDLKEKEKRSKWERKNKNKIIQEQEKVKSESGESTDKNGEAVGGVGGESLVQTSLASEVAKAREHLKNSLQCIDSIGNMATLSVNCNNGVSKTSRQGGSEDKILSAISKLQEEVLNLSKRVESLELANKNQQQQQQQQQPSAGATGGDDKEEDDVDLFGSESEEEDDVSKKIREQRLAEYAAKKSKKPVLIAKSNIILDVKPWDDETDMKLMEKAVRNVTTDGLVWGASKLVPLAFGIHKLQISCVVEDDKVSIDWLTETLQEIEDFIQSVDIAAFNKV